MANLELMKTQSLMLDDLCHFGMKDMAYIKSVTIKGQPLQSIHAADGTPLLVVTTRDVALATIRRYDLEPASVH